MREREHERVIKTRENGRDCEETQAKEKGEDKQCNKQIKRQRKKVRNTELEW